MGNLPNLVRAVADVVSVEGWANEEDSTYSIHIDVLFRSATIGGQDDDPVRFRLALSRAELVVQVPETEGLKVVPQSVARDRLNPKVQIDRQVTSEAVIAKHWGGSFEASAEVLVPGFAASLMGGNSRKQSSSLSTKMEAGQVLVEHRKGADGWHRWEMIPADGSRLKGSGWDAEDDPRFQIEAPKKSAIGRVVVLQIRCLREDMHISDIEIIPAKGEPFPLFKKSERNKIAAAEAFIKTKLAEMRLVSGDLSNRFAEICLLETTVEV